MIAIAWFAVRPLMAVGIVAAGLIAAFLVSRLRSSRRSGLAPTPTSARVRATGRRKKQSVKERLEGAGPHPDDLVGHLLPQAEEGKADGLPPR